jgi:glycosyltransferase involved in cell wall biosynthesis
MWRAVLALAADPRLRARLGEAARADITRRGLSWEALAQRVVHLAERAEPR